ncbi:dimethylamine monooxygenase subunit DmmA family protein [Sutcliffiella rhizosphaerae]|uniref:Dimethylamine monooxygenase subunit DmmA-like C-terminal domain-containing protein n=1 Tax=Sutcliffiella rhizosphaerae TaxID=2880967 RepID=A0ABM8YJR0_9BACI|nr:dimethylamine monooxygenase subunit DmmA family protein [Sutcliffiella rhizosphaerae]CAG9620015.1 hypothetical protein BACCIP111883_00783 [Sutcliffiella rhizosphaerae]
MKDIRKEAVFIAGKRNYVLCGDDLGITLLNEIEERIQRDKGTYQIYYLNKMNRSLLLELLEQMKMGTYLYLVADSKLLFDLKPALQKLGYSTCEAQYICHQMDHRMVFCSKCHQIFSVFSKVNCTNCPNCQLTLEVSEHYSKIKNAYLGYVASCEWKE